MAVVVMVEVEVEVEVVLAPEVLVVPVAPDLRQRQTRRIWAQSPHPTVTMAIWLAVV
jgi:hypothetical protein